MQTLKIIIGPIFCNLLDPICFSTFLAFPIISLSLPLSFKFPSKLYQYILLLTLFCWEPKGHLLCWLLNNLNDDPYSLKQKIFIWLSLHMSVAKSPSSRKVFAISKLIQLKLTCLVIFHSVALLDSLYLFISPSPFIPSLHLSISFSLFHPFPSRSNPFISLSLSPPPPPLSRSHSLLSFSLPPTLFFFSSLSPPPLPSPLLSRSHPFLSLSLSLIPAHAHYYITRITTTERNIKQHQFIIKLCIHDPDSSWACFFKLKNKMYNFLFSLVTNNYWPLQYSFLFIVFTPHL